MVRAMLSIQTTDPKEARRARLAQFQGHKAMLTLMGSTVRGLVRSVKEDTTSTPPRWIVSDVSTNAVVAQIDFAYREQFELKPPIKKEARRCRYAQHRGEKATVTLMGATATGLVYSVMEDRSANPKCWIVRIVAK
jgi:hypothetical protein